MSETKKVTAQDQALILLSDTCERIEASQKESQVVRDFGRAIDKVLANVDSMNGNAAQVIEAMGSSAEVWPETVDALRLVSGALKATTGEGESDEVSQAIAKIQAWQTLDMLSDEQSAEAQKLMERLSSLKPKASGTRGSGPGSKPLGFYITAKCKECGQVVRSDKDNLNSHRDQVNNHLSSKHAQKVGKANNPELHDKLTSAFKAVMTGQSNHEQATDLIEVEKVG